MPRWSTANASEPGRGRSSKTTWANSGTARSTETREGAGRRRRRSALPLLRWKRIDRPRRVERHVVVHCRIDVDDAEALAAVWEEDVVLVPVVTKTAGSAGSPFSRNKTYRKGMALLTSLTPSRVRRRSSTRPPGFGAGPGLRMALRSGRALFLMVPEKRPEACHRAAAVLVADDVAAEPELVAVGRTEIDRLRASTGLDSALNLAVARSFAGLDSRIGQRDALGGRRPRKRRQYEYDQNSELPHANSSSSQSPGTLGEQHHAGRGSAWTTASEWRAPNCGLPTAQRERRDATTRIGERPRLDRSAGRVSRARSPQALRAAFDLQAAHSCSQAIPSLSRKGRCSDVLLLRGQQACPGAAPRRRTESASRACRRDDRSGGGSGSAGGSGAGGGAGGGSGPGTPRRSESGGPSGRGGASSA